MLVTAPRDDLCLGFANTLSWRGTEAPAEELGDFGKLTAWLEASAGIAAGSLKGMQAAAHGRRKEEAAQVFADVIALRETIYRLFSAMAADQAVGDVDFAALKKALAAAPQRTELARADGRYGWRVANLRLAAPDLLAPVLWSAADLMLAAGQHRIRQCANEKCLWLFVDNSKTGTRRWCDMSSCGNRAKAQRHYHKQKQA
jgi:predicted RNA-binding Zn ribbon-like protein